MKVLSLEQTSLGANDTGSSVKQSCIEICSDGATLPSSSGYFQKYKVFSEREMMYPVRFVGQYFRSKLMIMLSFS